MRTELTVEEVIARLGACGHLADAKRIATEHQISIHALLGDESFFSQRPARRALYLHLRKAQHSYPEIGAMLGRHHTSIIAGVQRALADQEASDG